MPKKGGNGLKHLAWEKVENTREICTQWDGKRRIEEVDRGDSGAKWREMNALRCLELGERKFEQLILWS